ncbi:late competence development ComFB family protein [Fundidesulfovibrio soli]|uniref:late competence development ComFB family protein n=1 Tax=Fundidesulfovibrio soli TaxID=2922716 RepID=UPI001FAEDB85|nr:late competence development ComFB family protein [Fundidesulfovibrio soli]
MSKPELTVCGVDVSKIRNKNEARVAKLLAKVLSETPGYQPDPLDVQDIYALTLNLLPSRYKQFGTIVLSEPVKDSHIESAIRRSLRTVQERPRY